MKNILTFAFFFYTNQALAQEPAIEWFKINTGGSYGGTFSGVYTPTGNFFLLSTFNSRTQQFGDLSLYNTTDRIWNRNVYSCTGSTSCSNTERIVNISQNGGALLINTRDLRASYYSSNGQLFWRQNVSIFSFMASPLLNGGFYFLDDDIFINKNRLRRFDEDGNLIFQVNMSRVLYNGDIVTTSDDGVVLLLTDGLQKYNSDGTLAFENNLIGKTTISINNDSFGIFNNQMFRRINLSNGSVMWTYNLANIISAKVLNDGGLILLTSNNLTKLDINGNLLWNTNYGGSSMVNFESNEVAVINGNVLTKLNPNGTLKWQKNFEPDLADYYKIEVFKANDEGMYIIGHVATFAGTGFTPAAYLIKLAPDGGSCNYTTSIQSNNTEICGASKTLNAKFNNEFVYANYDPLYPPFYPYFPSADMQIQWKKDGNSIAGANKPTYQATDAGVYTLEISNAGCVKTSAPLTLTKLTANLNLSGNKDNDEVYRAENITSEQMIQAPAKVEYQASRAVTLNVGFVSNPNTIFVAKAVGCQAPNSR